MTATAFRDAVQVASKTLRPVWMAVKPPNWFSARQAAQKIGVSYPTMKKWILEGKIKTNKTVGGRHRVSLASLAPYLELHGLEQEIESRERRLRFGGRNQLAGRVVSILVEDLMAKVVLEVGEWEVTSIITAEAVEEMQLKVHDSALAVIPSTGVMIKRDHNDE